MSKSGVAVLGTIILSACAGAPAAPSGNDLTGAQVAALFEPLYPHWVVNCDDPGFAAQRVTFDIVIGPDGRLVGEPVPVEPQNDAGYRAAAESALTALRATEPFRLPRGYRGGAFRPAFNAARVCGG